MAEQPTVPPQPENKAPIKRFRPFLYLLAGLAVLAFLGNLASLSRKTATGKSSVITAPAAPSHPQVVGFQPQQQLEADRDQQERMRREQADAARAGLPGPEADGAPPMTDAQARALYGAGPNAPQRATSSAAELRAQARQDALMRRKRREDALNSDTLAIDFTRAASPAPVVPASAQRPVAEEAEAAEAAKPGAPEAGEEAKADTPPSPALTNAGSAHAKALADAADAYTGKLYRVFEGTVFEGVVTNHINGALTGPILVSLTTDYYSHDHQQLLLPQGTRLIGEVKSVSGGQQTRLVVLFHRAICPDGFSVNLEQYQGLDPLGTTGLSGKVDHGYFSAFSAAAIIGGLGGLTQLGSNGNVLNSSTEIRNGISEQTGAEATRVLDRFLNRLPVITLKEGSRARVYINRDILLPSYNNHDVDPTL